jgi:hypothetical protein
MENAQNGVILAILLLIFAKKSTIGQTRSMIDGQNQGGLMVDLPPLSRGRWKRCSDRMMALHIFHVIT